MRAFRSIVLMVASAAFLTLPAPGGNAESRADLAALRQATDRYHDLAVASNDGYAALLDCFQSGSGGMGQHYAQMSHLDGQVDVLDPEALVYEVRSDRLQLVAVEYIVPKSAWSGSERPSLFGHDFDDVSSLGVWALHAWIWHGNPDGVFAAYNPSIPPCPAS